MKSKLAAMALVVCAMAVCGPAFAHHGNVAYDETKIVVLKQVSVTRFVWANPHSFVMFDAKDDKGEVSHWVAEAGSPSALTPAGWTKNSVKPGDSLTVYLHQSKLGTPVGRLTKIVLSDGSALCDHACRADDPEPKPSAY